jgi:hypothetical protein
MDELFLSWGEKGGCVAKTFKDRKLPGKGINYAATPKIWLKKRFAVSKKSKVFPFESMARYKYFGLPLSSIYVSSTRQESFVGRR